MIPQTLLINAMILVVMMLILWRVAVKINDVSFIDAVWGGGMVVMAFTSWVQMAWSGDASALATVILAMVAAWGIRLFGHLFTRWRHEGEDSRYYWILKKDREAGNFARAALIKVFGMQAVLLFLVCLPAQLGILASQQPQPLGMLGWAGFAVFLVGISFEWIGDYQLEKFKSDPASEGQVLDTGLWRYTRHPNYFGDSVAWWGIWLAAASAGWDIAGWSVIGPIFLTFTLMKWSGGPLLERGMAKRRPEYGEYQRRTSAFFPLPPKARAGAVSSGQAR